MVYQDYTSSFDDLLIKDGSVCIHHRNIQLVAIEMFKVKYNLCPEILKSLFQVNTDSAEKIFEKPNAMGHQSNILYQLVKNWLMWSSELEL